MNRYSSIADDHYINMNLSTELELSSQRETVLHYFEQVQKKYPEMRNFYARDKGDFVLEEDKDQGHYRWCALEPRRICSGYVNPASMDDAVEQHLHVLEIAPYVLSVSPLDCEALDFLMGFDFTFRGNHHALVAEALGLAPALEPLGEMPGTNFISYEPNLTFAVDEDCRTQCRVCIEPRTNAYQIRRGEYNPEDQLSVYVTSRQYGSLDAGVTYVQTLERLQKLCQEVIDEYVIEAILQPLARTIALD